MNITYYLDSETGLMKLKFKKNIIESLNLDTQKIFKDHIIPMMTMNPKFVLTGSLSLKLLGFEPMDVVGDFDFGLMDTFSEEEYEALKNFFNLNDSSQGYGYENSIHAYKFNPKAHMWQLYKQRNAHIDDDKDTELYFKMDIFNDEILRKKDIISIYWDDFEIKLVHPSITYSYRMRYALDTRSSTTFKYWDRMDKFMKDAKPYYNKIRSIYKMIERISEHNVNVEGDKNKIAYLRNLIATREVNADNFFRQVFELTTPNTNWLDERSMEWASPNKAIQ